MLYFTDFSVKSQLAKEALCAFVSSWRWSEVCHCSVEAHSLLQAFFWLLLVITNLTKAKLTFHCAILPFFSAGHPSHFQRHGLHFF